MGGLLVVSVVLLVLSFAFFGANAGVGACPPFGMYVLSRRARLLNLAGSCGSLVLIGLLLAAVS